MADFPPFLRNPANRIDPAAHATPGSEGWVFDGVDGSQVTFWNCIETTISPPHSHDCDEYLLVVEGSYTLLVQNRPVELKAGQEYFIPKGVSHGSKVVAGTRTIHAFGGKRAVRG